MAILKYLDDSNLEEVNGGLVVDTIEERSKADHSGTHWRFAVVDENDNGNILMYIPAEVIAQRTATGTFRVSDEVIDVAEYEARFNHPFHG
ncbi:MAG: hypothetical protein IKE43_04425 [Coriobacteriales bacterium]|nr:hypothetical protein [Coriobacteriales bacterium]